MNSITINLLIKNKENQIIEGHKPKPVQNKQAKYKMNSYILSLVILLRFRHDQSHL